MADKIKKFLAHLPVNQLLYLRPFMNKVSRNDVGNLSVKPLKGHRGVYRLRAGKYRIIFKPISDSEAQILYVGKRDDQTYRDY